MSRSSGVEPAFELLRQAELFLKGAACLGCVGCCNQSVAPFLQRQSWLPRMQLRGEAVFGTTLDI